MLKALFPLLLLCSCSEELNVPLPQVGDIGAPLYIEGEAPNVTPQLFGEVIGVEGHAVSFLVYDIKTSEPFVSYGMKTTVIIDWRPVTGFLSRSRDQP
jgi:hypothetical protein